MNNIAYAEVIEILDNMKCEDRNKVPKKIYNFFLENSDKNYVEHLNKTVSLCEQEIQEDTKEILAILLMNYWCDTEEKKNNLLEKFRENEIRYQEELREKYNPDNIFKNNKKQQENIEEELNNTQLIEYRKKNIFSKILDKIKMLINFR